MYVPLLRTHRDSIFQQYLSFPRFIARGKFGLQSLPSLLRTLTHVESVSRAIIINVKGLKRYKREQKLSFIKWVSSLKSSKNLAAAEKKRDLASGLLRVPSSLFAPNQSPMPSKCGPNRYPSSPSLSCPSSLHFWWHKVVQFLLLAPLENSR